MRIRRQFSKAIPSEFVGSFVRLFQPKERNYWFLRSESSICIVDVSWLFYKTHPVVSRWKWFRCWPVNAKRFCHSISFAREQRAEMPIVIEKQRALNQATDSFATDVVSRARFDLEEGHRNHRDSETFEIWSSWRRFLRFETLEVRRWEIIRI